LGGVPPSTSSAFLLPFDIEELGVRRGGGVVGVKPFVPWLLVGDSASGGCWDTSGKIGEESGVGPVIDTEGGTRCDVDARGDVRRGADVVCFGGEGVRDCEDDFAERDDCEGPGWGCDIGLECLPSLVLIVVGTLYLAVKLSVNVIPG